MSAAEGFVRVKISCESERLGYLAYCGSEPMAEEFVTKGSEFVYIIPRFSGKTLSQDVATQRRVVVDRGWFSGS